MTEILEITEHKIDAEVAFISQSGGHTGSFFDIGENRGFPFNKVVSIGNQCDLKIQDFIEYFSHDPNIKVISCYIEQVKNVIDFKTRLQQAAKKKPVIFWKGGQTEEGIIAAKSHTGSIHSSYDVFSAAISQNGGIIADTIEELADLTLGSLRLATEKLGKNVAISVPGGGSCVEMTDQAVKYGLNVPALNVTTQERIQALIQSVNTSTRNPVDLGVYGWLPKVYGDVLKIIATDPNIDIVFFYMMLERLPRFIERVKDASLGKSFIRNIRMAFKNSKKPFIAIIPNFNVTNTKITQSRKEFVDGLSQTRIPYFESMQRAAVVINKLIDYQKWLNKP